jgi:hypothetical protein
MIMTTLMVVLGFLMMSHVLYPVVPKVGLRNLRGIVNGIFLLTMIALAVTIPSLFFFTALMGYVAYGVVKATLLGFMERLPDRDPMLDEEEGDEAGAELRDIDYAELSGGGGFDVPGRTGSGGKRRIRRRRRRGGSDGSRTPGEDAT